MLNFGCKRDGERECAMNTEVGRVKGREIGEVYDRNTEQ